MDKKSLLGLSKVVIGMHNMPQRPAVRFSMRAMLGITGNDRRETRHAVTDVLTEFQAKFPDKVTAYQKPTANRLSPIKGDNAVRYYHELIDNLDPAVDQFGIHLTDPNPPPEFAASSLLGTTENLARVPVGTVNAHVSLDWFADHSAAFIDMLLDWCDRLKPVKGVAGIAPTAEFGMLRSRYREIWPLLARFPGLNHDTPFYEANHTTDAIGCINWLTVLNDDLVARLGGIDALETALGPLITVHKWQGGVIIQAGETPEIGDRSADLWPEAYCRVNDVLRPIRYESYANTPMALLKVPEPLDAYEETLKWVRRFDRED